MGGDLIKLKMKNEKLKNMEVYLWRIRKEILKVLLVFAGGFLLGVIFYQKILGIISSLFNFQQTSLILTSPSQVIGLILSVGFFTGILVSFPFFVFQSLKFFKPALTTKEYRLLISLLLPSLFLLFLGLIYGFYIMRMVILIYNNIPLGIKIKRFWNLEEFLSQAVFLSAAMGVLFQLPVVLTAGFKLGFLKKSQLVFKRRLIYAILFVLAILLPPTDPLSLAILVLPLIIMFEGSLLLS